MPPEPIAAADLAICRDHLARGGKSFALAGAALPARVRDGATVLYAFCRIADDLVDGDPAGAATALAGLEDRICRAYAGTPIDHPVDRAFAQVVRDAGIPRSVFAALCEGFAWDAAGRQYESLEALLAYAARVAGTVGVMMCRLMGCQDAVTRARACELGVAMQLTNIARDVGEDARRGRLYLPHAWLREAGLEPAAFLAQPAPGRALARVLRRLLAEADRLYQRADRGIANLPADCRPAIRAARLGYAEIGRVIAANQYDSVTRRAVVPTARKLALLVQAGLAEGTTVSPAGPDPAPLPACAFLVTDAVGAAA